jgi:hypothetical protein
MTKLDDEIAAYAAEQVERAPEADAELVDAVRGVIHPRATRPAKPSPDDAQLSG